MCVSYFNWMNNILSLAIKVNTAAHVGITAIGNLHDSVVNYPEMSHNSSGSNG